MVCSGDSFLRQACSRLRLGYEQGAYSQVLVMPSFTNNPAFSRIANDAAYKGWSVSTLGLGGWVGALINGYCCDKFSRRWTLFAGGALCLVATALTTGARNPAYMVSLSIDN
jgi:MFS family permease